MNGKFTRIAALACAVMVGATSLGLAVPARGDDRLGGFIAPVPRDHYDDGTLRGLREPLDRFRRDIDRMYDVVASYGGDNYAGLRGNVSDLRSATDWLSDEIGRRDSHDVYRAFSSVRRAMDDIDQRVTHIRITREIDESWHRVNESFREVRERLR